MNTTEQQAKHWDTDREYTEGKITKVTNLGAMGWLITVASPPWLGKSAKAHVMLQLSEDGSQQTPVVGETARLFGPDEKNVRGIVIEGRVYCYITAAEAAEVTETQRREQEQERQKSLDEEREVRAARRALLPTLLQKRLDAFQARGGERWRRDVEAFELDVSELAARVVGLNPTHEAFYAFDDLSHAEQVKRVCGPAGTLLTDNAFQFGVALGGFIVGGVGSLVPFIHSAACGEGLGCEICACAAASPETLESTEYADAQVELSSMLAERLRNGDQRVKEPAEALAELDAAIRKVRPHNGGGRGMTPPRSTVLEMVFSLAEREMAAKRAAG